MALYERLLCILIGYFFGCFQTAYLVGKIYAKIDIRKYGSGNAGMTNTTRVLGAKVGLLVFALDMLKAILAYSICTYIFDGGSSISTGINDVMPGMLGGLGVVLGHNFPIFLKFKGGKGIAATIGVILCVDFRIAAALFTIGFIAVAITKFISLASLLITGLFPVSVFILGYSFTIIFLALVYMALAYYMHRSNIKRLLTRSENKFKLNAKGSYFEK